MGKHMPVNYGVAAGHTDAVLSKKFGTRIILMKGTREPLKRLQLPRRQEHPVNACCHPSSNPPSLPDGVNR